MVRQPRQRNHWQINTGCVERRQPLYACQEVITNTSTAPQIGMPQFSIPSLANAAQDRLQPIRTSTSFGLRLLAGQQHSLLLGLKAPIIGLPGSKFDLLCGTSCRGLAGLRCAPGP